MAWSRIDSGFWRHRKFAGWTSRQKWAFGELLGYCAESSPNGIIPKDGRLLPRSCTDSLLTLGVKSGLIDEKDGQLWIHNWQKYNPPQDATAAERMRRYRANKPETQKPLRDRDAVTVTERSRNTRERNSYDTNETNVTNEEQEIETARQSVPELQDADGQTADGSDEDSVIFPDEPPRRPGLEHVKRSTEDPLRSFGHDVAGVLEQLRASS